MIKRLIADQLNTAAEALRAKMRLEGDKRRRDVGRQLNLIQRQRLEEELAAALEPLFERQVDAAALRLLEMGGGKVFCPTGPGGGVDNSCSPGNAGLRDPKVTTHVTGGDIGDATEAILGRRMTAARVAAIAGASDGATAYIDIDVDAESMYVQVNEPGLFAERSIYRWEGESYMNNDKIEIDDTGTGRGLSYFQRQVDFASDAGIKSIHCSAGGPEEGMNGHYTWARVGYESVEKIDVSALPKKGRPADLRGKVYVSEMMKTQERRDYWRENGHEIEMVFDLAPDSLSRKVLNAYAEERAKRSGKSSGADGRGRENPGRRVGPDHPGGAKAKPDPGLARQVYNPRDWDSELIDRAFPVLLKMGLQAGAAQLVQMGVKLRRADGTKAKNTKASTATEWLAQHPTNELDGVLEFATPGGLVRIGVATEYPYWMKRAITELLADSMGQDYWQQINDTTLYDIENALRQGLREGHSIRDIARRIREDMPGGFEYYHNRAVNIARTEAGDVLNGARTAAVNQLKAELPPEVGQYMRRSWLSVLGLTTRDAHADLDGVPEDNDGMWMLGGIRIPWPGHWRLPPENRCHCQCTTDIQWGLAATEAQQMIQEYNDRVLAQRSFVGWGKAFCPTGEGGGVDPTCSPAQQSGTMQIKPTPDELRTHDVLYDAHKDYIKNHPDTIKLRRYIRDAKEIAAASRDPDASGKWKDHSDAIQRMINGTQLPQDVEIFRGDRRLPNNMKEAEALVGSVIDNPGLCSASIRVTVGAAFSNGGGVISAVLPKGSKAIYADAVWQSKKAEAVRKRGHLGEAEVLSFGTKFRIDSVSESIHPTLGSVVIYNTSVI